MGINNSLYPNDASIREIMRKVNAYGHEPRVIVELDKFSYVPGLKHKFDVVEYVKKTVMKTVTVYTAGDSDDDSTNASVTAVLPAVIPLAGKQLDDITILSRHGAVNTKAPKHTGVDIATTVGESIIATWPGTVEQAKYVAGNGNQILIDHGNGFKTRYAHLSKMSVQVGDKVNQAQQIGLAGQANGENSEGADVNRLHFEVIKDGTPVNPEPYFTGAAMIGNGTGVSTSKAQTKTGTEVVTYQSNFRKGYEQVKYPDNTTSYASIHSVATALGTKYMMGFKDLESATSVNYFTFKHTWFKDGYLNFDFYANLGNEGDTVKVKMDGKIIYKFTVNPAKGIYTPPSFDVPKGKHTFTFSLENTKHVKKDPQVFGVLNLKCVEFDTVSSVTKKNTNWAFHDTMNNANQWNKISGTLAATHSEGYISFYENVSLRDIGIYRNGDVKFPMTVQATLRVSDDAELAHFVLSDGNTKFNVRFDVGSTTNGQGKLYVTNNTQWQDYLFIAKDPYTMKVYHKRDGQWYDTEVDVQSVAASENTIKFMRNGGGKGGMDISDVKYAYGNIFYNPGGDVPIDPDGEEVVVPEDEKLVPVEKEIPVETIEEKVTPKWYDLGGFAYDTTFYLEDDIISWEVNTHMDMSSTTAEITLDNRYGLYSPDYLRASIFPDNKLDNPYSYVENGILRHIISENTPVRIYVGYGSEIVRVFTGMIKGEIQEDSENRTLSFSCVDRYDLLEEAIVLKEMSFPPADAGKADETPRPWLKSSIIQYIANEGGMVGWRYNHEDIMHPDLVIEETYYTDVSQTEGTFMKFDENGKLVSKALTDAKSVSGYMNPFVQSIAFAPGERLSDCIRTVADEINFRAYCNRYGTFVLEHVDYQNNMKWEFSDGDNLQTLTSSSDFSRVRNHLQIVGSMGNVEHFFDKDLFIATKGAFRSAQLVCDWIDESTGVTARGAKQVVADKLFFDMKRQARTKNVVVKGNPFIEILDGAWVYDAHSSTAGYYIIKGNRLTGNKEGFVNQLELTWEEKVNY